MACQMALMEPDMVEALIVVDILPLEYESRHTLVFEALSRVDIQNATSRVEVEEEMTSHLNGNKSTAFFLLKNLKRKKEGGFEWRFNLPVLINSYDEVRGGIGGSPYEGATLFIKGGLSTYIEHEGWLKTTYLFPTAYLTEISDAGHWVHVDKGEELLSIVLSFLEENL